MPRAIKYVICARLGSISSRRECSNHTHIYAGIGGCWIGASRVWGYAGLRICRVALCG